MAWKKRTDSKGRILRNGEMQRSEDGRYLYRYTDLSGKKKTVYALTLVELREKEKQIKQLHVKAFYSGLEKQGLAASTIKLYHNLIFPALELAVDSDIIRKNPAKDCRRMPGGFFSQKVQKRYKSTFFIIINL